MFGLKIVTNSHLVERKISYEVTKWPIKKRRRNWTVTKRISYVPMMLKHHNILYIHPDLLAAVKKASCGQP